MLYPINPLYDSIEKKLKPDYQKALLRRGLAFEALERFQLGLADIRRFISIAPNNPIANKAQHRLGQAVRLSRQYKKDKK